jgi:predicted amidohydrolase
MDGLRIASAQFEHKSGDKEYNLKVIDGLSKQAASDGAAAIACHECSITGYTFARHLSSEQMLDLAEPIPEGPSIKRLRADCNRTQYYCTGDDQLKNGCSMVLDPFGDILADVATLAMMQL